LRASPGSDAELEVFIRGSEPRAYAAVAPDEAEAAIDPTTGDVPSADGDAVELPHEVLRPIEERDLSDTD